MSRWLLVELESDLAKHYTTRYAAFLGLEQVPGVRAVTDVSAISRATLDEWVGDVLLPPDQSLVREKDRRKRKE